MRSIVHEAGGGEHKQSGPRRSAAARPLPAEHHLHDEGRADQIAERAARDDGAARRPGRALPHARIHYTRGCVGARRDLYLMGLLLKINIEIDSNAIKENIPKDIHAAGTCTYIILTESLWI